jgi:photosystem II stability/assembly factor-like uncharacterized protein
VNTVKDLRQALSEEVRRLEPPAGLETRVVHLALRGVGTVAKPHRRPRHIDPSRLVAALLAVVIVVSLIITAHALHLVGAVPANHGRLPNVQQQAPTEIQVPSDLGFCPSISASNCPPLFVSPSSGWAIHDSADTENLYRTDDSGKTWHTVLSWTGSRAQIGASLDQKHVVVVTSSGLKLSSDGGAHWNDLDLPVVRCAVANPCGTPIVDFRNPLEGWLLFPEQSQSEIFHTSDSGVHWSRLALVNNSVFQLLMNQNGDPGIPGIPGGRLVFATSMVGWLIPYYNLSYRPTSRLFAYRTDDGGVTWKLANLPSPQAMDTTNAEVVRLTFFGGGAGVLELAKDPWYTLTQTFLYTTVDGGKSWAGPVTVPNPIVWNEGPSSLGIDVGGFDFIDSQHWVAYTGSLLMTSDAGVTWKSVTPNGLDAQAQYGPRIDFVDTVHGWLYSDAGLFATSDGGNHWVRVSTP